MGGDTLVVQTAGFRNDLWIDIGGSPLSDAAKMTERMRRPNYGALELEITIEDPKVYTRPLTVKMTQNIEPDTELADAAAKRAKIKELVAQRQSLDEIKAAVYPPPAGRAGGRGPTFASFTEVVYRELRLNRGCDPDSVYAVNGTGELITKMTALLLAGIRLVAAGGVAELSGVLC